MLNSEYMEVKTIAAKIDNLGYLDKTINRLLLDDWNVISMCCSSEYVVAMLGKI